MYEGQYIWEGEFKCRHAVKEVVFMRSACCNSREAVLIRMEWNEIYTSKIRFSEKRSIIFFSSIISFLKSNPHIAEKMFIPLYVSLISSSFHNNIYLQFSRTLFIHCKISLQFFISFPPHFISSRGT